MARRTRPPSGRRTEPIQWSEVVPGYASTILKFSLLAMLVAGGYVLYGIFGGYLNQSSPPERLIANMRLAGQVLAVSGSLATLCLVIITFKEIAFAVVAGIVGLGFFLGTPFVISNNLRNPRSDVADVINFWGTWTGKLIIIIVGLRLVYEIYLQLTRGSVRGRRILKEETQPAAPERKKPETIQPWTPCWQMPFCHAAIRDLCPAYKAHRTCWRYGSGCNCDPKLVESVIRSGAGGGARDAQTRRLQEAYIRSDLEADTVRPQQKRTIPCSKCPIYNEHQRAKYRVLNPIAIIGTIVAFIVFYGPLMRLYEGFIKAGATLASRLTFSDEIDPTVWFEYLDTPAIRAFFVIILGLLILSYVLRAVEWAILVKKI